MTGSDIRQTIDDLTRVTTSVEGHVTALRRARPTIAVSNASTVVTDDALRQTVAALQIQIERDLAPAWGISATVVAVPTGHAPDPAYWAIAILDDSDQANALGYHQLTPAGLPAGKVFARTDQQDGIIWSTTLSHEALELLVDPWAALATFVQTGAMTGTLYALEVGDPVQSQSYGIDGVALSNFVTPAWFEAQAPAGQALDYLHSLTAPLTLAPQSYMSSFPIPATTGWVQTTAEGVVKPVSATDDRRFLPKDQWQRSTPPDHA